MSSLTSRLAVTAVGLPIVLGAAYLGGWTLLALVAIASLIAQHELYRVGRQLRPLVLAGYAGTIAALLGVQLGGLAWMFGGALLTIPLAFAFAIFAQTRGNPSRSRSPSRRSARCGSAWASATSC